MKTNYTQYHTLIWSLNLTLSGRCHHLDSVVDDAHQQYAIDLLRSADALVLGRKTFKLFADFWPHAQADQGLPELTRQLAAELNAIPKYVVSARKLTKEWVNSSQVSDIPALKHALRQLKNVVGLGSPCLLSGLVNSGLITELHLLIQPFIGVGGPSAFAALSDKLELDLLGHKALQGGSVLLRYSLKE